MIGYKWHPSIYARYNWDHLNFCLHTGYLPLQLFTFFAVIFTTLAVVSCTTSRLSHEFLLLLHRNQKNTQTTSDLLSAQLSLFLLSWNTAVFVSSFTGANWTLTRHKQLTSSCFHQVPCNHRVSPSNIISTFGALVILTGLISFSLGHHTAIIDLTHIIPILNLRQEIWDLQRKKTTAERIYKIMNLFPR